MQLHEEGVGGAKGEKDELTVVKPKGSSPDDAGGVDAAGGEAGDAAVKDEADKDDVSSSESDEEEEQDPAAAAKEEKEAEEESDLNPESGLPPNPRYTALLSGKLAEMLNDIDNGEAAQGGWKKNSKGEKAKIAISTKVGEDGIMCAKGQGVIDAPIDVVLDLLRDQARKGEWDDKFDRADYVERLLGRDSQAVFRMLSKGQWPVGARDFAICSCTFTLPGDEGKLAIVATGLEHEKIPVFSSHVRGRLKLGGYVLTPLGENQTNLVSVTKLDLAGSLPSFVMQQVMEQQPMCIDAMRKAIARKK
jgi:hypothetical protein